MAKHSEASKVSAPPRAWDAFTPALPDCILNYIAAAGFEKPTPVQGSTIPLFRSSKDVVVEAVTGSGKTISFLIPVIEKLLNRDQPFPKHHIGAIVISPTRELASQIHAVLVSILQFHPPSASLPSTSTEDAENSTIDFRHVRKIIPQLIVGGASTVSQDLAHFLSASPNIIVATPGRLRSLLQSPFVHCQSSFEVLVLDEADRLLDMGFEGDLQAILGHLPKQRRTGLFSASVSEAVDQIIRVGLRNPVRISVKVKSESGPDRRTPASLQMSYLITSPQEKIPAAMLLLGSLQPSRAIIYLSTCASVDYFQHILATICPFHIIPLHGKYVPKVREKNFRRFTESISPTVLLTTDVAARGLDIPTVDLVIQIDPPSDPKVFIHRCGRAGRAGRKGMAVTMLSKTEEDYVSFLKVRNTPISPLETPELIISDDYTAQSIENMRQLVLTDRALHDLGQKAFVSWYKAYHKSCIFRVSELDWTALGNSFALLKLPRMPELKSWEGDSTLGLNVDFQTYKYKDAAREKHRLELIDNPVERPSKSKKRTSENREERAWSDKKMAREEREEKREKRHAKKHAEKRSKMSVEEIQEQDELEEMISKVRRQNQQGTDEWTGFD